MFGDYRTIKMCLPMINIWDETKTVKYMVRQGEYSIKQREIRKGHKRNNSKDSQNV